MVVIAPPDSRVPHFDLIQHNVRAFLQPGEPTTVKFSREWLSELQAGALLPGDAVTARYAGVKFVAPVAEEVDQ